MKRFFWILGWIIVMALAATSLTSANTSSQQELYQRAYYYGITTQPTIEKANLDGYITRQAFAKMVVTYLENVVWTQKPIDRNCLFLDENTITKDLVPYTKKICSYDVMWKDGTKFNPTQPLDKAQLWTVLSRILWWDEYNSTGKWYYVYHLNALKYSWIMDNIGNPTTYVKRWEAISMLKKAYENYGSKISINWFKISAYSGSIFDKNNSTYNTNDYDNDYIWVVYEYSNVIYTSNDGTKYYYDDKFLNLLKDTAEEKWESDLEDYLEIEANYYKNWFDQLANLDDEKLLELIWMDIEDMENIDFDNMTRQEKQKFINKIRSAFEKFIEESKDKNNQLVKDLGKVTKNISKDKFWLKDKYEKTKSYIETTNTVLDLYSESLFGLIEIALMEDEEDEYIKEQWMTQAFWLIWIILTYQWTAQEYQEYIEEWAVNTANLLELN